MTSLPIKQIDFFFFQMSLPTLESPQIQITVLLFPRKLHFRRSKRGVSLLERWSTVRDFIQARCELLTTLKPQKPVLAKDVTHPGRPALSRFTDHFNESNWDALYVFNFSLIVYYLYNRLDSLSYARVCFIASKQNEQLHEFTASFT